MDIFFDIETRPCDEASLIDELTQQSNAEAMEASEAVKAPSNYKDEAKIAEYISTKRAEIHSGAADAVAQKIAKTSLDGSYGRICCTGWAIDDNTPESVISASVTEICRRWQNSSESQTGLSTCRAQNGTSGRNDGLGLYP